MFHREQLRYCCPLFDIVFDVTLSTIGNATARTSQPMIFRILERISCSMVRNTGAIYTHAQKKKTKLKHLF
jgi:hypothetical protein